MRIPISKYRVSLTLLFLLLAANTVRNADAQLVRAYVVEDSITVGDRFTLVLVAEHAQPDSVVFPNLSPENASTAEGTAVGDVLALRRISTGRRLLGVGHRYPMADTAAYEATTFAVDTAMVAPMQFTFVSPQRSTLRQTDPFPVFVSTVLDADASELRDIEPLAGFPRSPLPSVLLLAALAGGYFAYRWFTRPAPPVVVEPAPVRRAPPPPVESPLAEATRRLAVLEKTDLSPETAIKPYFVELTEILRNYIERRLHITALESTSGELIAAMTNYLPKTPIPVEVVSDLSAVLETADLAKFADVKHAKETCVATLSETRVLVLRIEDSFRPVRPEAPAAPESEALTAPAVAPPAPTSAPNEERPAVSDAATPAEPTEETNAATATVPERPATEKRVLHSPPETRPYAAPESPPRPEPEQSLDEWERNAHADATSSKQVEDASSGPDVKS